MDYRIREAVPDDFDGVFELLLELREHFEEKGSVDGDSIFPIYLRFLDSDDHHVFIAETDGRPVALMSLSIDESLYEEKPCMVIDELIVTAAHRGRGVGRLLVDKAVALARERRCSEVCVDTTVTNEGAIRFYRARGFGHENILFEMELDEEGGE
jgi:ribosomal protein S18 acetylase RimI-like enzyme